MARGHPYGFNIGHGRIIPLNDYLEAARALLERNLPEVFFDRQTKPIFVPEVHLPKMPRLVDLEAFKQRKKSLTTKALESLGRSKGTEDVANFAGDFAEKGLTDALKEFYDRPTADKKVVILLSPTLRKGRGGNQENDCVIVDFVKKAIICIESKAALIGKAVPKAVTQTLELKSLLEEYFASELASGYLSG